MWEVPYEEIRPGRPIKLQVPPIQEDTVLYVLRVRVPEKLSLQQLEQLRKNWAQERLRKQIGRRAHAHTGYLRGAVLPTEVCNHLPRGAGYLQWCSLASTAWRIRLYGTWAQDTAGAGVDRTRYTGGYFLYAHTTGYH
jgi:hypothetical protein